MSYYFIITKILETTNLKKLNRLDQRINLLSELREQYMISGKKEKVLKTTKLILAILDQKDQILDN